MFHQIDELVVLQPGGGGASLATGIEGVFCLFDVVFVLPLSSPPIPPPLAGRKTTLSQILSQKTTPPLDQSKICVL